MLIERLLRLGKRVDAIGMQYHSFWPREAEAAQAQRGGMDPVYISKIMDLYARFNKPLQITEITIPAYSWGAEDEDIQAEIIKNM